MTAKRSGFGGKTVGDGRPYRKLREHKNDPASPRFEYEPIEKENDLKKNTGKQRKTHKKQQRRRRGKLIHKEVMGELKIPKDATEITIPKSLTSIDMNVFSNCEKLECIKVEEGNPMYKSANGMLLDNGGTKILYVPRGMKGSLCIPEGIIEIKRYTFYGCIGLTGITIPKNVKMIKSHAFMMCKGLCEIILPEGVKRIGRLAFAYCSGLKSVAIPKSVCFIEKRMFYNCKELTKITLPASIIKIGYQAFSDCTSLKEIYFKGDAPELDFQVFQNVQATVYYQKGTKGWKKTFGGLPTKEIL